MSKSRKFVTFILFMIALQMKVKIGTCFPVVFLLFMKGIMSTFYGPFSPRRMLDIFRTTGGVVISPKRLNLENSQKNLKNITLRYL